MKISSMSGVSGEWAVSKWSLQPTCCEFSHRNVLAGKSGSQILCRVSWSCFHSDENSLLHQTKFICASSDWKITKIKTQWKRCGWHLLGHLSTFGTKFILLTLKVQGCVHGRYKHTLRKIFKSIFRTGRTKTEGGKKGIFVFIKTSKWLWGTMLTCLLSTWIQTHHSWNKHILSSGLAAIFTDSKLFCGTNKVSIFTT